MFLLQKNHVNVFTRSLVALCLAGLDVKHLTKGSNLCGSTVANVAGRSLAGEETFVLSSSIHLWQVLNCIT